MLLSPLTYALSPTPHPLITHHTSHRYKEYKDRADFAIIYLEEAHPTDGWMYPAVKHQIVQHTEMAHRVEAAKSLIQDLQEIGERVQPGLTGLALDLPPMFVDTMDNLASCAFGALPERLVVLGAAGESGKEGRGDGEQAEVLWLGGKGPEDYRVSDCRKALQDICP